MAGVLKDLKLYSATYNAEEFTSATHLSNAFLSKSEFLSPIITFLYAGGSKDYGSYNYPLLYNTEGLGNVSKSTISTVDLSYKMAIVGSPKRTSTIATSLYSGGDTPGRGQQPFTVIFKDRHFYKGQSLRTPSGKEVRVQDNPSPEGTNFVYRVQLVTNNLNAYVPLSDLAAGVKWSGGIVKVGKQHSRGTESRSHTPYEVQNQITLSRQSYPVPGNMAKKVMVIEMKIDGKLIRLWTHWELYLTRKMFMDVLEEDLFHSKYNKLADGSIRNIDEDSGEVITSGAGALQQITNSITYSSMSGKFLRTLVSDLLFHANGSDKVNLKFFTGTGGTHVIHEALKNDVLSAFNIITPDVAMQKNGDGTYSTGGPYFNKLISREGHSIEFVYSPMMDRGGVALNSPRHPVTGWPTEGYNMYCLDFSERDGKANIQYVSESGRESVEKIVPGMAALPIGYDGSAFAASDVDASSIEWMKSHGISIATPTNCAKILFDTSTL